MYADLEITVLQLMQIIDTEIKKYANAIYGIQKYVLFILEIAKIWPFVKINKKKIG